MKESVTDYGPLVQFVVSVYALLSSLAVGWFYVYNKLRLRRADNRKLVVKMQSFNINNLKGLKALGIISGNKKSVGLEDLRALWMNAESRNKLLTKALGSYDSIEEIFALDSSARFATRVSWAAGVSTLLLVGLLCFLFLTWQPGTAGPPIAQP